MHNYCLVWKTEAAFCFISFALAFFSSAASSPVLIYCGNHSLLPKRRFLLLSLVPILITLSY